MRGCHQFCEHFLYFHCIDRGVVLLTGDINIMQHIKCEPMATRNETFSRIPKKNKNLIMAPDVLLLMKCPYCTHDETKVMDKRETEDLEATRRRSECLKCGKRFTTYERIEEADIVVVKKDGSRERFNRQKLINGILKACEKRPITTDKIETLVDAVESDLRKRDTVEVDSRIVGNVVMRKLKSLDKVAYIRFASVYLEFEDLDRFG